ncbi:MAG TPA: DUF2203 domain-containing protein [bacterium]|nr:DUF2203 domain-containing protein [bacterium]
MAAWRYFSVGEAVALLPRLREMLDALRRIRDQTILKRAQLDLLWQRLDRGEALLGALGETQQELDTLGARVAAVAGDVEATGCILRDVDRGLVDFAFRSRGGGTVFLCWHLGEPTIAFWHGVDEGYAGRRPISELPLDDA